MVKLITPEWESQSARVKWIISGLDYDKNFNEWEQEFIESVEEQSNQGAILSDKQMDILEQIYRRYGR